MAAAPMVSIVIPVHNGGTELLEQLDAIDQSARDVEIEILVVDNRSTDATAVRVAAWSEHQGYSVRVVDASERAGEPYARNVGWRAALGSVVLFCDADDVVAPEWVSALATSAEQYGYATGPVGTDRLNPPWLAGLRGRELFDQLPRFNSSIPFAHGCNMGFRRDILEQLDGFDESFVIGCDIELGIRASLAGVELGWNETALVHYRLRSTPRAIFTQAYSYAKARPSLDARAAASLSSQRSLLPGRVSWLLRNLHRVGDRSVRSKMAWVSGQVAGEAMMTSRRFRRDSRTPRVPERSSAVSSQGGKSGRKVFLDVGGHRGETVVEACDPQWEFEQIVSFEPVPECIDDLLRIEDPRVRVVNAGWWSSTTEMTLNNPGELNGSIEAVPGANRSMTCRFVDASRWMSENIGFDDHVWLKLNVEGAEIEILKSLLSTGEIGKVDHLMVHFDAEHSGKFRECEEMRERLWSAGIPWREAKSVMFGKDVPAKTRSWLHATHGHVAAFRRAKVEHIARRRFWKTRKAVRQALRAASELVLLLRGPISG